MFNTNHMLSLLGSAYGNFPGIRSLGERTVAGMRQGPDEYDRDYRNRQNRSIGSTFSGAGLSGDYSNMERQLGMRGEFQAPRMDGMNWGYRGPDGTGLAGMEGAPSKTGPGVYGYYGMGVIPTAWNNEISKPRNYNYSGTPDLAKMIRNPWDPTRWDPNYDFVPTVGSERAERYRHTGGRRRRRR